MKQRRIPNAPRDTLYSNGQGRAEFQNKLQDQKSKAIRDSVSMLFRGVRTRKQNPSLPTSMEEFIKSNFLLCFANLEEKKFNSISGLNGWIASISIGIVKHEHGVKIFEWTMNRAIAIAHQEKGDAMPQAIIFLFEASSKVSSLGKTIDVTKFFGAYKGMPISHLLTTTGTIATAETYTEFHKAISHAHSEAQQIRLSGKDFFSSSGI